MDGSKELAQRQWFIVRRWQEYTGEGRACLVRAVAIGSFYAVQLVHFHTLSQAGPAEMRFHRAATALAAAWSLTTVGVFLCLRRRFLPSGLKYVASLSDVVFLTALASLGGGPHSPTVAIYYPIVALSAVRFSLPLIWATTLACMLGYWSLVGQLDPHWFDAEHLTPPVEQAVIFLSLGMTGVVVGQVVRRNRAMVLEFERRMACAQSERIDKEAGA